MEPKDHKPSASANEPAVQRLHPSSILFGMLGGLRGTGSIIFIVVIVSQLRETRLGIVGTILMIAMMLLALAAISFAFHFVRYLVLRIRYEGDEIVIRQGILFRSERHIPYRRIQNIDVIQNVMHRLFNVGVVKIETSSGGEIEAELRVLSLDAVNTMRERVFADRPQTAAERRAATAENTAENDDAMPGEAGSAETSLLALRPRDLVQIGLITNRGLAILSVAFGIVWQLDIQLDLRERYDLAGWTETILDRMTELPALQWIAFVLAFVVILYTFSICWSFMRFYDFRLVRRGDDLRVSCGLLTRVAATIPRRRLQFITVRETLLHRLFGKVAVRVETAGTNAEGDEVTLLSRRWFVPLLPIERVNELLEAVQPEFAFDDADWQRLLPKARRRMIRRAIIKASILGVAATVFLPWYWGLLVWAGLIVMGALHAWRLHAVTRWAMTERGVVYRTGVITRKTSVTLFNRVQVVSVRESFLDRRWDMAKLFVDTAGAGTAGHHIYIRDLAAEVANRLRREITLRAERAGFHWA